MKLAPRVLAAVACATAVALLGTACGSGEDDSSGNVSSADGNAVIDEATANVEAFADPADFTVEPLSGPVPAGKVVAQVNCTIPQCLPGGMDAPVEALDWTLERFDYDLTKGTQDYLRAVDAALASKPDYLAINISGTPDLIARQLEQAKADGIPVVASGSDIVPEIAFMAQSPVAFSDAGANMADIALADAGKPVTVAMPIDPSLVVFTDVADGVEGRLSDAGASFDRIEVSLAQPTATNVSSVVNYLKANPDTQYLVFIGTALSTGLEQGLRAAGLEDKVKLILSYPYESDLESIKDGVWLDVLAGEATFQWRMADALARLAAGDPIEDPKPSNEFRTLTPENASVEAFDPPNYATAFQEAWGV